MHRIYQKKGNNIDKTLYLSIKSFVVVKTHSHTRARSQRSYKTTHLSLTHRRQQQPLVHISDIIFLCLRH